MFFIVLYALYAFYIQVNPYARIHVLVLIDSIFLSFIFINCIVLSGDWFLLLKYLFLWFFVFISSMIGMSLLSDRVYLSLIHI